MNVAVCISWMRSTSFDEMIVCASRIVRLGCCCAGSGLRDSDFSGLSGPGLRGFGVWGDFGLGMGEGVGGFCSFTVKGSMSSLVFGNYGGHREEGWRFSGGYFSEQRSHYKPPLLGSCACTPTPPL